MTETTEIGSAAPFWISILLAVTVFIAAIFGGWTIFLIPFYGMFLSSIFDRLLSDNTVNIDPETDDSRMVWHRMVTLIWLPIQFIFVFFSLIAATRFNHMPTTETVFLFIAIGVATGGVGIVYAHELIHQKSKLERNLGDALLAMVLYGHFRTKHILIHHRYVGTPKDPVTARYNEGFHRFFFRLLPQGLKASWKVETARLAKRNLSVWDRTNPFWRYTLWPLGFLAIAWVIGGWAGVGLYLLQALIAVTFLELTNYVEHYGLVRKHLGEGKYEHVHPHHSWNSSRRFTNYLLINLQRHSDHHYKPDRRFPLLQTYASTEAPQLPYGYPMMAAMALIPPLWRRVMNPRVRKWRAMYYPEITDWKPYNKATNPPPR
ncbi:MAG: alkane 1-monooxygenase [Alphaproteobacteria bacterium]